MQQSAIETQHSAVSRQQSAKPFSPQRTQRNKRISFEFSGFFASFAPVAVKKIWLMAES
jgi:hypothetical protein